MSQLPDVRVSSPKEYDDYDADFELARLDYVLAKCQVNPSHLRVPSKLHTYQRLAISSDDLHASSDTTILRPLHSYNRSRSDTCLAEADRCIKQPKAH